MIDRLTYRSFVFNMNSSKPYGLGLPLSLIAQLRAERGKQIYYQW